MIARKGKAGSLRLGPHEDSILKSQVGGRIKLLARDNDTDDGLATLIANLHVLLLERNLDTLVLNLVINDRGIIYVSGANSTCFGLDNKEILERLGTVDRESEVCEVVAKLHGLVVHAIHPTSQHGNLGSGISPQGIACIAEMLEGDSLLGLGGIDILGNTGREQQLAAVGVVHQQLDGAKGSVILSDDMGTGRPGPGILAHRIGVLIGTIDESLVLPAIAPRVGNNPGTDLILIDLAYLTIAIEVELYTVVIATNGKGMVKGIAPTVNILHAYHTRCLVGNRRRDCLPVTIGCHTYASYATAMHGSIATVIIEPFLELLTAFGRVGRSKGNVIRNLVPHSAIPLVVSLHPAIVGIVMSLCAKEPAVGASPIGRYIRNTDGTGHSLGVAGLIGQQPCEMRGILVLGQ